MCFPELGFVIKHPPDKIAWTAILGRVLHATTGTYHKATYTLGEYGEALNFKAPYTEYECKGCHDKKKVVEKVTPIIYGTEAYCSQILELNKSYYDSVQDLENAYMWASYYVGGPNFENRQDIDAGTFTFLEDYSYLTLDYFNKNKKDVVLKVRFTPDDTENFETIDFTVTFRYGNLPMSEEGSLDDYHSDVYY